MNLEWRIEKLLHAEGQFLAQCDILLAPDDHRRRRNFVVHPYRRLTIADILAEQRSIVIDRGGDRVWIAKRGAIMLEILVAEGRLLHRAIAQRPLDHREVPRTQHRLRQTRNLEKQDVPTLQHLAWTA